VIDEADDSTEPSNAKARVDDLINAATAVAHDTMGNDVMFTMGGGKFAAH